MMTKVIKPYSSFIAIVDPPADATTERGGLIVPEYIDMEKLYIGIVVDVGLGMSDSGPGGWLELERGSVVYYKKAAERYEIEKTFYIYPSAIIAYEEA